MDRPLFVSGNAINILYHTLTMGGGFGYCKSRDQTATGCPKLEITWVTEETEKTFGFVSSIDTTATQYEYKEKQFFGIETITPLSLLGWGKEKGFFGQSYFFILLIIFLLVTLYSLTYHKHLYFK